MGRSLESVRRTALEVDEYGPEQAVALRDRGHAQCGGQQHRPATAALGAKAAGVRAGVRCMGGWVTVLVILCGRCTVVIMMSAGVRRGAVIVRGCGRRVIMRARCSRATTVGH